MVATTPGFAPWAVLTRPFGAPDDQFPRFLLHSAECIPGFRFQVSGFRFQVLGFGFWVLGFQVSGFRFRVSGFGFRKRSAECSNPRNRLALRAEGPC